MSENQVSFKFILRALHHRNYRLFFGGQSISLIGTWMQQIAMSWLVYRLTNSALLLGIVGFSSQIPVFLFASIAGVYADRWNRHRILVVTQTLAMIQALILAFLTLTGAIQVWHIIVLSIFLGVINAFDMPTRQSFIVELIEKAEDLGNAIALNSFMFNGARLVGPAVAGILIGLLGEGVCFLINGISFLGIIFALIAIKVPERKKVVRASRIWQELKEGYSYAFGFAPIRYILLQLGLMSFMGMSYAVLMPIFAKDILHGGPHTLGFLMAASGIGALTGSIYLASRQTILGLGRFIAYASAIFGIGIIAFSLSKMLIVSLSMMLITGFGMIVQMASSNTILQSIVDEDKRGRVMSIYATAIIGVMPLGNLFAGTMASWIGAPNTLIVSGIACIIGSLIFAVNLPQIRKEVRPIYIKMGIISGIE
ncbi:MAG: MFS transporter [Deltaproteobacteria bacterium]|nr:MFS transporter [Deltaproteobacteria bacterium]